MERTTGRYVRMQAGFDAWEGQDSANDKKAIIDGYGKDLAEELYRYSREKLSE